MLFIRRVLIVLTLLAVAAPSASSQAQDRVESSERVVSIVRVQDRRVERERRAEQRRSDGRESQSERITRTVNIGPDGELDVSNVAGDIVVTRTGGTNAIIDVVKTARAATADEARAALPLVSVDIMERGPRVEVRARYPRGEMRRDNRRNLSVDVAFTIAAPQNTRLVIKSISGNITVSDISGGLMLDSVSGTVKIANAGRVAAAKSISGDVELIDSRVDGSLSAGTISGTVRLRRVTARNLTLSSVSGNVLLEDISCDRIEAQAISGDVNFSGDFQPNGRYEFTSHSGAVHLAIGGGTGFQVEATSFSGGITADLPITMESGQAGGRRMRTLRGKYGNGSAILELTSFSGPIVIKKR